MKPKMAAAAAAAASIVVFWWALGLRGPTVPIGPMPGTSLPSFQVGNLEAGVMEGLRDRLMMSGQCTLLVVVSTACPVCARMRYTWPQRFTEWSKDLSQAVLPVWVSEENAETLRLFTSGFQLAPVELLFNADKPNAVRDHLGIVGTPTLYVVDASGVVRLGVAGDRLPTPEDTDAACRQ